ncbi:MAG: hypothetical protein ACKO9V_03865 [Candidatus Kapaibacterium sp.]
MNEGDPSLSGAKSIVLVAITCIAMGGCIGAVTNMVNAAVSPVYFITIMKWTFNDIWTAAIAEGIIEGLIFGILFALVFATGYGMVTKGRAPYGFARSLLLRILMYVFAMWAVGGVLSVLLALLSADFFHARVPLAPKDTAELLRFAWVGGSIQGAQFGAMLCAVLGIVVARNAWNKETSVGL